MKIVYFGILVFILLHQSNGAVVRKQPAFAKPTYSNSYLPAAMQVIFHAVDQLKNLEAEENEEPVPTTMSVPTTSPHAPGQHQPTANEVAMQSTDSSASASAAPEASTASIASDESTASIAYEASTASIAYEASTASIAYEASTASVADEASTASITYEASTASIALETSTASIPIITSAVEDAASSVTPEQINDGIRVLKTTEAAALESETPEENYGTPETNHEIQEPVQEMTESNQEVPEKSEEAKVPETTEQEKNSSEEKDDDKSSSEESKESDESNESKEEGDKAKSLESSEEEQDERQSAEEEDDEIRFTLIGEKVSQVPRPSLTSYLRKTVKSPIRGSIQELATLYDALSKDARKQGLAKFSGYSDEVLKTLESTMDSGVGPQLRALLEKAVKRNDLTREDTKIKVSNALNHLSDPASALSRDLRRVVPLHFIP